MIKCSICSYQCDNWYVSNRKLAFRHAFIPIRGGDRVELFLSSKFVEGVPAIHDSVHIIESQHVFRPALQP